MAMGKRLKFVDISSLHHLMEGLSMQVGTCAKVLDDALFSLDKNTGIPARIIKWNQKGANLAKFPKIRLDGRLIVEIEQLHNRNTNQSILSCVVRQVKEDLQGSPAVFFNMRSPSLNIPMRVEVPLRAVVKGGRKLKGTYTAYLHALLVSNGEEFVYYGITKRGWNTRFMEHVTSSLRDHSKRLFPLKIEELIHARAAELSGIAETRPSLAGIVTAVCAIGLTEVQAMDVEEYLVDKYSLSSKHEYGLNMIPGGYEGIRVLHALALGTKASFVDTESREQILGEYLKQHPRIGVPNPLVAAKWNDPEYAEAVICGRQNRLKAGQVREIRYLAALGYPVDVIRDTVGAVDDTQVTRVLAGRTYARIH